MMIFFGNQVNRQGSEVESSFTSTLSADSSIRLEEMIVELNKSTIPSNTTSDVSKVRVDGAVDILRKSIANIPLSNDTAGASLGHRSDDDFGYDSDRVNEFVDALTKLIIKRDQHNQSLVGEIAVQDEHILLLQQQLQTHTPDYLKMDTMRNDINSLVENIKLKDEILKYQEKRIDDQAKQILRLLQEIEGSQANCIKYEGEVCSLDDSNNNKNSNNNSNNNENKVRGHNFVDRGIDPSKLAPWDRFNNGFATRIIGHMGYEGGGLGKHGDGIVTPIETSSTCSTHRNGIGSPPRVMNTVDPWRRYTTLIIGDSILSGVDESKLSRYFAKVRSFSGARIDDIYDYIKPLLAKKPTNVILHVGTNDSNVKTADEMFGELMHLREFIQNSLPDCTIYLSTPTLRIDNAKANATLRELANKLKVSSLDIVDNGNISSEGIGKKGLHLNEKGSGRLALNYINLMKQL